MVRAILKQVGVKAVTAGGAGPAGGVGGVVLGFDDFFFEGKPHF